MQASAYLDTSFIAPYYLAEASSQSIEAFIQGSESGALALSDWTGVEFASLLARKERMRELSADIAALVGQRMDDDVSYRFDVLTPQGADYALAKQFIRHDPTLGLRGPDALHLAVAAGRALVLHTLDRTLLRAAQAFGIEATDAGILDA